MSAELRCRGAELITIDESLAKIRYDLKPLGWFEDCADSAKRNSRLRCKKLILRGGEREDDDQHLTLHKPIPYRERGCLPGPACFSSPFLACFLACVLSPRGWQDEHRKDSIARARMEWATADDEEGLDAITASLNARVGSLPHPTIEHSAVKRKRQLGAGGFAAVFEAVITPPGQGKQPITCACKVFSFVAGMGERQTNFFKNWLHELKVLDYLSSRPECGIVEFYGFSTHHQPEDAKIVVQICMELMKGGSLRDNLLVLKRKGQRLPLRIALRIMLQVAASLRGLHAAVHDVYGTKKRVSIVHRDMKPENVLLSCKLTGAEADSVTCKLCDVGLAALRSDRSLNTYRRETTKVGKAGTYPYIAPETLLQGKCDPASDVFSLGLIMWELVSGDTPFHDVPNLDGMLPVFWQNGRRPVMDGPAFTAAPRPLRALIERCWQVMLALEAIAAQVPDFPAGGAPAVPPAAAGAAAAAATQGGVLAPAGGGGGAAAAGELSSAGGLWGMLEWLGGVFSTKGKMEETDKAN